MGGGGGGEAKCSGQKTKLTRTIKKVEVVQSNFPPEIFLVLLLMIMSLMVVLKLELGTVLPSHKCS